MSRKELEAKAFDIIRGDMEYIGTTDEEIWEEIKNTDDKTLKEFIEYV